MRALAAGVDLLLYTSGSTRTTATRSSSRDAQRSAATRAQIARAVAHIRALERPGLGTAAARGPSRSSVASSRRQCGRTLTISSRKTGWPSSCSISGRARVPISLITEPPLPTTICFCDSVSTSRCARSDLLVELLDLDRDRVRHLVAREPERLLADQLGDLRPRRSDRCAAPAGSRAAPRAAARRARRAARAMPSPVFALTGCSAWKSPSCAAAFICCAMCPGFSRSTLLSAITTGMPSAKTRWAMKRSPAPIRSRAESTSSDALDVLERRVDGVLHPLGQRVAAGAGSPAGRRGRAGSRRPFAMPKMRRRVVCGLSETIATLPPQSALTSVDLPTFGRPATATKPDFSPEGSRCPAAARPGASSAIDPSSRRKYDALDPPLVQPLAAAAARRRGDADRVDVAGANALARGLRRSPSARRRCPAGTRRSRR